LKGTDGKETPKRALALGAKPVSPERAREFLKHLRSHGENIKIVTCSGIMGEEEAEAEGFSPTIIRTSIGETTSADDTRRAAVEMVELRVDLIVFVGGDGTARDIHNAIDQRVPVLGVPSGVKMQSSVFALNPRKAAEMVVTFLRGELQTIAAEVVDVDEDAFRAGRLEARLYGYMRVPSDRLSLQSIKRASPSTTDEREDQRSIARYVVEEMESNILYIVGPGTTTQAVFDELGLDKTLLGVDLVLNGRVLAKDVGEQTILQELNTRRGRIIVTPIGGQGFVFGRGNQQISPEVIRHVGVENVVIVATPSKISSLRPRRLLVDTGDPDLDSEFKGFRRVIVGYREEIVMRVE